MGTRQSPRPMDEGSDDSTNNRTATLDEAARIRLDHCVGGTAVVEYVHRCRARAR